MPEMKLHKNNSFYTMGHYMLLVEEISNSLLSAIDKKWRIAHHCKQAFVSTLTVHFLCDFLVNIYKQIL